MEPSHEHIRRFAETVIDVLARWRWLKTSVVSCSAEIGSGHRHNMPAAPMMAKLANASGSATASRGQDPNGGPNAA
jgi:hypothetical protein